jgi:hypothetical protein
MEIQGIKCKFFNMRVYSKFCVSDLKFRPRNLGI